MAHDQWGWYKIEINKSEIPFDTVSFLTFRLEDKTGNIVWDILKENHLFDMKDDRRKEIPCIIKKDTISKNGETVEVIEELGIIDDGPQYEFEIFSAKIYKKLHFYSPQYYNKTCPGSIERKWIVNCINAFEKFLGN